MRAPSKPELIKMLARVEWVGPLVTYGDYPVCLFCNKESRAGHTSKCKIGTLLAKVRKASKLEIRKANADYQHAAACDVSGCQRCAVYYSQLAREESRAIARHNRRKPKRRPTAAQGTRS